MRKVLASIVSLLVVIAASCNSLPTAAAGPPAAGWLGSIKGSGAQNQPVVMTLPANFSAANLLVAVIADDGPDTVPVGIVASPTTAVIRGGSGLRWTRLAHVSARHDVALPGDRLEKFGASSAEVWAAVPPKHWRPAGTTITEIPSHPHTADDGHSVVISAYSNGIVDSTAVVDGLGGSGTEHLTRTLPVGSAVYAAVLEGRVNADFRPTAGSHTAIARRAGDDTMGVVASDSRALPAGLFTIGQLGDPGPYWEEAMVVVAPRK